ncbi:hypothetical protein [Paraburkholderia caledonica]|uniref:hypothetical protein n=1 Tax=Paraburkholderia caledonica TaxID=134536 RepID=UPI0011779FB6|nr:hypothetical protein [Paraburkholderia caledonica]
MNTMLVPIAQLSRRLAFILLVWSTHVFASVSLSPTLPGAAIQNSTVLLVALPIKNFGDTDADNVVIRSVVLLGGYLQSPARLPVSLGTIASGERGVLNLSFIVRKLDPAKTYKVLIEGQYGGRTAGGAHHGNDRDDRRENGKDRDDRDERGKGERDHEFHFVVDVQLPPPAPGSDTSSSNRGPTHATQGPYPLLPQPPQIESNEDRAPTPIGSPSFLFPHTATDTGPKALQLTSYPGTSPDGAVGFIVNTNANGIADRFPPDPSAVGSGTSSNLVLATANLYLKYSTDGGSTFTTVSNFSTVFGDQPDGGYCCDQVVHYIPSIDRLVWLIQTNQPKDSAGKPTGGNRLRIAWARPADVAANFNTAWTWFDVTSNFLGLGSDWLDYPDLSTSDGYLYASVDDVTAGGLVVMRISYKDLQLPAGNIVTWDFTAPKNAKSAVASHLTQNATGTMYWAGHDDNSHLRVFSWADGSNRYFWSAPKPHNSYASADYTSKAPDGQYWYAPRPKGDNITSAVHRPGELWFAWTAARDTTFAQPYVIIAKLSDSSFDVTSELEVWNSNNAYAYPALAANSTTSEVAISLMWGGGDKFYLNHAVGFLGDFVVWITTSSDVTFSLNTAGTTGCDDASGGAVKGRCTRSGDYLSLRRVGNWSGLFSTLGYEIKLVDPTRSTDCATAPGCRQDVRYVEFGRPRDVHGGGDLIP